MTGETYRAAIEGRYTAPDGSGTGGGACNLVVIRLRSQVLLLHHGALSTGAALTPKQAAELADCLATAAGIGTDPRSGTDTPRS
ncbi:MAG: hypothetical protein GEV09_15585 [Pseudonocardiaceae bacterium]|nr:hypothetical protein [Pseudonocardiaceae bacterium]